KSLYDPDANLMRNTVETLAATVSGADIISLYPHDFRYSEPTAFGQRMAVNIQHLLRNEGHLQRVRNPVDGSYFLESVISQLAEKAWALFLKIEKGGGYRKSELVNAAKQFHSNVKEKEQGLLRQERVVVGTTRYANPLERIDASQVRHHDQAKSGITLWENIRLTIDGLTEAKQPGIAILAPQTGNNAEVSKKITFITGIITSLGLDIPPPIHSLKEILAEDLPDLLIVCADETWYQSHLASVATKSELSSVLKIAVGRSPILYELRQQAVINEVLNAKSNLTAFLGMINKLLS
ncbi:MAG: methylmalonyl-CoA mutase family protein, partial [Bacteroidota bacterium]